MKRSISALLVVLFAAFLLPGTFELIERTSHLVVHGDFVHDASKAGHVPFNVEHGCSGGLHLCSCCHSLPFGGMAYVALQSPEVLVGDVFSTRFFVAASGFPQARQQPPRA